MKRYIYRPEGAVIVGRPDAIYNFGNDEMKCGSR